MFIYIYIYILSSIVIYPDVGLIELLHSAVSGQPQKLYNYINSKTLDSVNTPDHVDTC